MGTPSDSGRLILLAEELGINPFDLDDLVYDLVGEGRAASFNSGEDDEAHGLRVTSDDEADIEAWDDAYDGDASAINNCGLHAQVPFLVAQLGAKKAEAALRRIVSGKDPVS